MHGLITLYVKMHDNAARVWFRVIDALAVDILLQTLNTDRCIWYTFSMEQGVVPV